MSDHSELKKAALRVVEIESSEGESISDAWEDFESAANPAAVLELIAEVERLTTDNTSLRGSCAKLGAEHAGMVRQIKKLKGAKP